MHVNNHQSINSMIFQGPSLTTLGPLLQDGKLSMVEKQAYTKQSSSTKEAPFCFFLFEEVLLFCKEVKRNKVGAASYKYKGYIPTAVASVKELAADALLGEGSFRLRREILHHGRRQV